MARPKIVYSNSECWVGVPDGVPVLLRVGDPWYSNDVLVKARPELFNDHAPSDAVSGTPAVETATAEPGETRVSPRTSAVPKRG